MTISGLVGPVISALVKSCPSLRFVIGMPDGDSDSSDEDLSDYNAITKHGSTFAVATEAFGQPLLGKNYRLLRPLIVPYLANKPTMSLLTALCCDYLNNRKLIKYLVEELHFDLNYTYVPVPH